MGNLGSFFPPDAQRDYAARQLVPGQVLYLDCDFTTPPKVKYLVLVAATEEDGPLLFFVNSRINPYIERRPALLGCQVRLSNARYGFLEHDCYIDCSRVVDEFSYEEIRAQIAADASRVKGELDSYTKALVAQAVAGAVTISARQKRVLLEGLRG